MSHDGNKPFQFIVDGCEHRFGTHVWNTAYFNMWDPMCQVWLGLVSCRKGSLSITSEDRTAKLFFFIVRYGPVEIGLENTSGLLTSAKAQVRKFLNI